MAFAVKVIMIRKWQKYDFMAANGFTNVEMVIVDMQVTGGNLCPILHQSYKSIPQY
ncbi:hypothetical protein C5167_022214 [Papaver somniferum]|uniref:Uncharacterized protein n=1 Tax=Papaver somniferum TaxID=3469 RepID=A0A4Y7JHB3_PAPSO|nr:hypothetical protein C5167_022214 [Papaver somniferum]